MLTVCVRPIATVSSPPHANPFLQEDEEEDDDDDEEEEDEEDDDDDDDEEDEEESSDDEQTPVLKIYRTIRWYFFVCEGVKLILRRIAGSDIHSVIVYLLRIKLHSHQHKVVLIGHSFYFIFIFPSFAESH